MAGLFDIKPSDKPQEGFLDYARGFAQSGLSSIPELFGADAPASVEAWRASRPISGLVSELAGTSVPYFGWAGATRKLKAFDNVIQGIGDLEKAPIAARAAQEIVRFAPFEAGRGLIASTWGGEPIGDQTLQTGVNLAMAGVGGGVFGALEAAGKAIPRRPMADIAPGVDPSAPLQVRLRQLKTALDTGEVKDATAAQARLATWMREARTEVPGYGQRFLAPLEGDESAKLAKDLERLFFKPSTRDDKLARALVVREFSHGGRGFKDEAAWRAAAKEAELEDNFPLQGQFFRHITADAKKTATLEAAAAKLTRVGPWSIGREADGNYIVLKRLGAVEVPGKAPKTPDWMEPWLDRVRQGEPVHSVFKDLMQGTDGVVTDKPNARAFYRAANKVKPGAEPQTKGPGSRWLAFKTDNPSAFDPELAIWNKIDEHVGNWIPPESIKFDEGGDLLKAGYARGKTLPFSDYSQLIKTGRMEKLEQLAGPLASGARQITEHYLTPSMNQFARHPLANYVFSTAKDLFALADHKTSDIMLGARNLTEAKDLVSAIWHGTRPSGKGLQGMIQDLTDEQVKQFYGLVTKRLLDKDLEALYTSGQLDEQVYLTFKAADAASRQAIESLNATLKAVGKKPMKLKQGHSGFSRKWEGSLKQGLVDESGKLVAIVDADNNNALKLRAKFIEDQLELEGIRGLRRGEVWNGEGPVPKELRPLKYDPGFLKKDLGVRGYKWDFGQFGGKLDLIEELNQSIGARYRYEASEALGALTANQRAELQRASPQVWEMLEKRLNQLQGENGPITIMVNKLVDPVLGGILGRGSAGKIVDGVNAAFWHLQLGMFNMAYPVTNLLGIFQTVVPELAFVMGGAPERMAGYYTTQLVKGNTSRGIMSVLDPVKMLAKGMKSTFRPEGDLIPALDRAMREGVIDPKFLEEFAGQKASQIGRLKDILHGGKDASRNFVDAVAAISSWMPSASERFARAVAFNTAYVTGRDIRGLSGEALYGFAKRFTERTMYNYSMADRSMVLTSPVGRLFGSMKNWVSHYISNMMLYAGEAGRGNIAPLAWQMATSGAIGGLGAIPFLPQIAGGYANAVENQDLVPWLYGAVGQRAGDALYMGLPATLGVSFASATANPIRDANMLFSLAIWDRAQAMGRGYGAAMDHWEATGQHPVNSEIAMGSFARAFAPKNLYRALQVYDNPGIESLTTGYPIIDEEVDVWNKALYVAGFNPNEIERGYVAFEALLKDKASRQSAITKYGTALADGMESGNTEQVDSVIQRAITDGLDLETVLRSAKARMQKGDQSMLERTFSQTQLEQYNSFIGE